MTRRGFVAFKTVALGPPWRVTPEPRPPPNAPGSIDKRERGAALPLADVGVLVGRGRRLPFFRELPGEADPLLQCLLIVCRNGPVSIFPEGPSVELHFHVRFNP